MKQDKTDFKYSLELKPSLKNTRNITFRCDDDIKADEQELLAAGVELASHFRRFSKELFADLKAQLKAKRAQSEKAG